MRGGAYGTQTSSSTVNTGTTSTQGLSSEQIVSQLGYGSGCPTVQVVNPGTVYLSYCYQGAPVVESFSINADSVLTTNINEACSVYNTLLTNIGATSIDCSTSSARVAPSSCVTTPTPTAPTPVTPTAPTPVAPTPTCPDGYVYSDRFEECRPISTPTPTAPTPVAPTPVAPTPTGTTYYAYGCCSGEALVVDGPNNNTARSDYRSIAGCQESGATTNYQNAVANAQAACPSTPTPVAPTPTASYPTLLSGLRYCASGDVPNPASPCTQSDVTNGNCKDGTASGPLCTPAPTPVAPTPVAPTPTASYPSLLSGWHYCASGDAPNPSSPCPSNGSGTGVNCVENGASGSSCTNPNAPTPVAPTPVAPTPTAPTPVALDCSPCDPALSGGACGPYGNGTLCWTPNGCPNRCDGDHAPAPVAPAPVAPVAPAPVAPAPAPAGNTCATNCYWCPISIVPCGYNNCVYDGCGGFSGYTST